MLTIVIDGPEKDRQKLANDLSRDFAASGLMVRHYREGWPDEVPEDAAIVIIQGKAIRG